MLAQKEIEPIVSNAWKNASRFFRSLEKYFQGLEAYGAGDRSIFQRLEAAAWRLFSFERELILGETLFVAHDDQLLLESFTNGRALFFTCDAGEVFFFATGVDAFFAGCFL